MLRFILCLLLVAAPAAAQSPKSISKALATQGLAATEADLAALADPTPTDQFALGAVRFLRGIEVTLQTRWRYGMNAERTELPVFRLPVPSNPTPEPFQGAEIEALFSRLIDDMAAARAPLADIADTDQVALPIAVRDLWFDIDMDGARGDGEGLFEVAGLALTGRPAQIAEDPVIRFDTADAAWLAAYTHFISGFAELVLAFAPADVIDEVMDASFQMAMLGSAGGEFSNALDMQFGQQIDRLAMIYFALRQQPDPARTRAARAHLLDMIAQNRVFWTRVAAEDDNDGEWLPNDRQQSGLGFPVAAGTGTTWLAVLDDAEALLNGTRLIPFWRLRENAGLNMARMFEDPIPVDLAGWAHGIALLPYAEQGQRVSPDSWRAFERLVSGDALMFVLLLN